MATRYTRWDVGRSLESRIGEYESALRVLHRKATGEATWSEREAALRRLATEHEFRMLQWSRRLRVQPNPRMCERPVRLARSSWWWVAAVCIGLPAGLLVARLTGSWGVGVLALGSAGWLAGRRVRDVAKPEKQGWRTHTLRDRLCASCEYDLSRHGDAIAPADLAGWKIGPRRCPECGASWPLVPSR